jgi:phosphotransferase system  glucose/maltose/N-acetylglucosamine-specific IIC component
MVVTRPGPSGWIKPILTLVIAILIGGCCVIGAREIVQSLDAGVLNNRKGPNVVLADRPLLFWSVVSFYVGSVAGGAGLAVLLAGLAIRDLVERRD